MANEGKAPVDFDSPVGEVRLLIGDTDPKPGTEDAVEGTGEFVFYSDVEIAAFIRSAGGVRPAASGILRAIAASTVLKLKKWSSADLMVDGPSIAAALLKAADAIDTGTAAAAVNGDAGPFFAKVAVGGPSVSAGIANIDGRGWPFGLI